MMICLSRGGMEERNLEFAAALSHAVNDWQIHDWVEKDRRLKAGIVVPQEYPEYAVREIDTRAVENEAFRQVILSPRSSEPLGRRKYWPIYEAMARNKLVLGLHPPAIPAAIRPAAPAGAPITCRSITHSAPAWSATSSA